VQPAQPASAHGAMAMFSKASSYFVRRPPAPGLTDSSSGDTMPFQGTRGAKRSATSEELVPATAPATKLHKDASGDVLTAATVAAAVPTDTAGTTPAAQPMAQLTQVEWQAILARLTAVERLQAQLTEAQSQLKAAEASFSKNPLPCMSMNTYGQLWPISKWWSSSALCGSPR